MSWSLTYLFPPWLSTPEGHGSERQDAEGGGFTGLHKRLSGCIGYWITTVAPVR
jgi:hypothetical protein